MGFYRGTLITRMYSCYDIKVECRNDASRYRMPRQTAECYTNSMTCISALRRNNRNNSPNFIGKNAPCYSNSKHCNFRKKLNSKMLLAIIFIILNFNQHIFTSAAIARVPKLMNLDQALESSRCTVREEVVDIRKIHPTIPSNIILSPSCVVLNRCSGCCQSDVLQCKPTSAYITKVMISRRFTDSHISDDIILEFTHHDTCACKGINDNTPVCLENDCEDGEKWSSDECKCIPRPALLCPPRQCSIGKRWNADMCACQPVCAADNCARGEMWESSLCPIERCPFGQVWSIRECACAQKCPTQPCGERQVWNRELCKCHCKSCHPKRLYHARFNLNLQTCQCSCRDEEQGREQCRKRGTDFDPRTCTCDYTRSKHRGRRG